MILAHRHLVRIMLDRRISHEYLTPEFHEPRMASAMASAAPRSMPGSTCW